MNEIEKQLEFLLEADKIKNILRMNYLSDGSRRENDAEHSWHLCLMAIVLSDHSRFNNMDVLRVLKMLLIHDLVEIDAGDAYVYDAVAKKAQREKELKAADRIFNLLPQNQAEEYRAIWDEFEEKITPESKFANALDRLHPMFLNFHSGGRSWIENNISKEQVLEKNKGIEAGSESLWEQARKIIETASEKGYLT